METRERRKETLDVITAACAAAAGVRPNGGAVRALQPDVDWSALLVAGARMRVLPVLAWYAQESRWDTPDWFTETLEFSALYWDRHNLSLIDESMRIATALEDASIPCALRKGVHVCQLYARAGMRPFRDIDVFISAESTNSFAEVVLSLGYEPLPATREQRAFFAIATNAMPGYAIETAAGRAVVDPSVSLLIPALAAQSGRLDGGIQLRDVALASCTASRGALPVLAPPYLLLDLVVNLVLGATTMRYVNRLRFQRLTPYMDVLTVAATLDSEDWWVFRSEVDRFRLHDAVTFAFGNGQRLFGRGMFASLWKCETDALLLDEYGALEFGQPRRWDLPIEDRMFLDRLPESVPCWESPI